MTSWGELRSRVRTELAAGGVEHAAVEARWIVERAGDTGDVAVGERAPALAVAHVEEMIERRIGGEPLQYVLGEWSFRGLDVMVDPRVLIPRPETEVTAEVAIEEATRLGVRVGRHDPWVGAATVRTVADLGTGSGVLALALAASLPDVEVWATDLDPGALATARANLAGAGSLASRVRLAQGSWFEALSPDLRGALCLVVTNPPYVSEAEATRLPREVREHEPRAALVAGPTGFEAIATIIADAPGWLEPRGTLVLELAPHQAERAVVVAREVGFTHSEVRPDLAGRDRVLVARRGG